MIRFEFLTDFQLATFILGIVFSILTIAVVFYALRHPNGFRSTFVKVLFAIILPMITFIMWFACVFAAYELFETNELYIMLLAIGCGAALSGITTLVAWLINLLVKRREIKAQQAEEEAEVEETEEAEEVTEEVETEAQEPVEEKEAEEEEAQTEETVEAETEEAQETVEAEAEAQEEDKTEVAQENETKKQD